MDIKAKIKELLSRFGLVITLGCVIANMIINRYFYEQQVLYTVIFAVAAVGLFLLFDQLRKRRFLGPLIYTGMLVGVVALAGNLMGQGWRSSYIIPTDWFYLDRANAGFVFEYFLALYIFGGFFIISILYYFTQVRFRSLGLMLCLLFPFVIYAKRADYMSPFQVTLIITLFLAIIVHHRQQQHLGSGIKPIHNLAYYISLALFVSFAGALAMLIPTPEVKSVLERDSHAFDIGNANNTGNYSGYSRTSSPRFGLSYTNEILFYCESTYPDTEFEYIKRQAYINFDSDEVWKTVYGSDKYAESGYYKTVNLDRTEYYADLKAVADSGDYSAYGLDSSKLTPPQQQVYEFRVYDDTDSFRAMYVPTPAGAIWRDSDDAKSDGFYIYGDGEADVMDADSDYDYTVKYLPETEEIHRSAASLSLTGDEYYSILKKAQRSGVQESEPLLKQYEKVMENYTGDVYYSDRLRDLAFEITKDCDSDYAKAAAIVKYFEDNDYVYDLEYEPEDKSIDYFLFESKTGSCTSYATAMTLMARVIGLPARYVEGFVAYEKEEDGDGFVVRDSNAHAYVEVFIPGAGWLTFDPTVEGYMVNRSGGTGISLTNIVRYFGRVAVFLAVVLFVLFVIMLDRIIELVFRIRLHFAKDDGRITRLYRRTAKHLSNAGEADLSAYTVRMLTDLAASRWLDIYPITSLFEKTVFGQIPLDDAEFEDAFACYKKFYKGLKKQKRRRNTGAQAKPESE